VGAVVLVLARVAAGPVRLAFLDQPVVGAIGNLAPGLTAEIGGTALVRSGRGVALAVSGLRLATA